MTARLFRDGFNWLPGFQCSDDFLVPSGPVNRADINFTPTESLAHFADHAGNDAVRYTELLEQLSALRQ